MIATTTHSPEASLKVRYGPEALITRFGAIWLVHVETVPGTKGTG